MFTSLTVQDPYLLVSLVIFFIYYNLNYLCQFIFILVPMCALKNKTVEAEGKTVSPKSVEHRSTKVTPPGTKLLLHSVLSSNE